MLSLSIDNTKDFMAKLLKTGTFDDFELHNLAVHNFAVFEMHKHPAEPAPMWELARPYAFDMIKGSTAPKYIKVVLARLEGDVHMFLNITFEEGKISITSGMSQKSFSLDKSAYHRWNEFLMGFLSDNNISFVNNLM